MTLDLKGTQNTIYPCMFPEIYSRVQNNNYCNFLQESPEKDKKPKGVNGTEENGDKSPGRGRVS